MERYYACLRFRHFDLEIIAQLERVLGDGFDVNEWQKAINLTCFEHDDREENRSAAESLKRDQVGSASSSTAVPAALPAVSDQATATIPELSELEPALGLALMQAGCARGQEISCVQELLSDVTEAEAETQAEMTAANEEELMEEISSVWRTRASKSLISLAMSQTTKA